MPRRPNITPEQVEQMRVLRDKGRLSFRQIADKLGVHSTAVYYWLSPKKREEKNNYNAARMREQRPAGSTKVTRTGQTKQNYILPTDPPPPDLRPLTARLFGDPMPGRSALDMKLKEKELATNTPETSNPSRPASKDKDEPRRIDRLEGVNPIRRAPPTYYWKASWGKR